MKNIVIIGAGFAGIELAKQLSKNESFEVILVDKNNYHFFSPLIYQVATGFLDPYAISYPLRKLVREYSNVRYYMGELLEIKSEVNTAILSTGRLQYDQLVIATGTVSNYFGMENIEKYAIPMKTLEDAFNLRNLLLLRMEKASRTDDETERKRLLTVVVAGGGPTGVEIAGMLAEMKLTILAKEYPELSSRIEIGTINNINLVDGGNVVLSTMSEKSQQYTYKSLVGLGVNILLNTYVSDYDGACVRFKDGTTLETYNLIWAAGVAGSLFPGISASSYGRGKRILVDGHNRVKGYDNIFAIGDICLQQTDSKFPNGHPQVAQVAIQQGKLLAAYLKAVENRKKTKGFSYTDKGSMAIIGKYKAVAELSDKLHYNGFVAWYSWLFVHLLSLANYRNRIRTLYNWGTAFLTKDLSLRMLFNTPQKSDGLNKS
nr:NAD(P)/FAD-dependent oxidoreductase [Allomuricauda sp.]